MIEDLIIQDGAISCQDVVSIALRLRQIRLTDDVNWHEKVRRSREVLERASQNGTVIYGMNTGVGNSSKIQLAPGFEDRLQPFLMAQHGCGIGPDLEEADARAVIFARLVSLSKGNSAVRLELLQTLVDFINSGLVPAIPSFGSVGASGDLTPLSYLAAAIMGTRMVYSAGQKIPSSEGLAAHNLKPFTLASKEGIALINGTSVMTGIGIMTVHRARQVLIKAAETSALMTEVMCGDPEAFHPFIHAKKPFPGQVKTAAVIYNALQGSQLVRWSGEQRETKAQKAERPVQDRYSIRCAPHAIGAALDAVDWIDSMLRIELNSVNDNPMVDGENEQIFMGGNFYGGHVALAMDMLKIALASIADLLDRQFALLVDEANNRGLPESLIPPRGIDDPEFGLYHGLKGLQITMSAIAALTIQRAQSDTLLSRPTEAGNQDKVSMGTNAAHNARDVLMHLEECLAILMIALSQAAFLRNEGNISPQGLKLIKAIRHYVPVITRDEPLDNHLNSLIQGLRQEFYTIKC